MKKIVRSFLLIIIIILPFAIATYFTYDAVWSVLNLEKTQATIQSCFTKTSSSGKPINHHVPKAQSENGEVIEGMIGQPKFFLTCDDMVGKTIDVYLDKENKNNNRIGTFWQMWFLPSLFIIISIFWYSLYLKKLLKKLKKS